MRRVSPDPEFAYQCHRSSGPEMNGYHRRCDESLFAFDDFVVSGKAPSYLILKSVVKVCGKINAAAASLLFDAEHGSFGAKEKLAACNNRRSKSTITEIIFSD